MERSCKKKVNRRKGRFTGTRQQSYDCRAISAAARRWQYQDMPAYGGERCSEVNEKSSAALPVDIFLCYETVLFSGIAVQMCAKSFIQAILRKTDQKNALSCDESENGCW